MSFLSRLLGKSPQQSKKQPAPPTSPLPHVQPQKSPARPLHPEFMGLTPPPQSAVVQSPWYVAAKTQGSPLGFAVIDLETSGLSPQRSRIIEIAVVQTDIWGRPQREWAARVNPQSTVGPTHIHGIRQEDVASAPLFRDLIPDLVGLLRGRALVAHNARFDTAFLGYEFGRSHWAWPELPTFCTLTESHHFLPHLHRRRLSDCCDACGVRLEGAHTALGDARATAVVLQRYFQPGFGPDFTDDHQTLVVRAANVAWPSAQQEFTADAPDLYEALPPHRGKPTYSPAPATVRTLLVSIDISAALNVRTPGALSYLEVLAQALADGHLSPNEHESLDDLAQAYGFDDHQRSELNHILLSALCAEALADWKLTKIERDELKLIGNQLGLQDKDIKAAIDQQTTQRRDWLGANLAPLPPGWDLGQPLRIHDRVCFTGECGGRRMALEEAATTAGIRVVSSVSRQTALLVTTGELDSRKAAAAIEHGTRVVDPHVFDRLLRHIQPAEADPKNQPVTGKRMAVGEAADLSQALTRVAEGKPRRPSRAQPAKDTAVLPEGSVFDPGEVRRWAREQGIEVGERGRLRQTVVTAYLDAHKAVGDGPRKGIHG